MLVINLNISTASFLPQFRLLKPIAFKIAPFAHFLVASTDFKVSLENFFVEATVIKSIFLGYRRTAVSSQNFCDWRQYWTLI